MRGDSGIRNMPTNLPRLISVGRFNSAEYSSPAFIGSTTLCKEVSSLWNYNSSTSQDFDGSDIIDRRVLCGLANPFSFIPFSHRWSGIPSRRSILRFLSLFTEVLGGILGIMSLRVTTQEVIYEKEFRVVLRMLPWFSAEEEAG